MRGPMLIVILSKLIFFLKIILKLILKLILKSYLINIKYIILNIMETTFYLLTFTLGFMAGVLQTALYRFIDKHF